MNWLKHRKLIHWIVALAILMSALAPAISQALSLSKNGQGFVVEICSTDGSKVTQVIADDESSSPAVVDGRCPYCVVQPLYLLSSISAFEFVDPLGYTARAQFTYQAPQIPSAWVRLPSRAPPTES
jgi:hypothetical protein